MKRIRQLNQFIAVMLSAMLIAGSMAGPVFGADIACAETAETSVTEMESSDSMAEETELDAEFEEKEETMEESSRYEDSTVDKSETGKNSAGDTELEDESCLADEGDDKENVNVPSTEDISSDYSESVKDEQTENEEGVTSDVSTEDEGKYVDTSITSDTDESMELITSDGTETVKSDAKMSLGAPSNPNFSDATEIRDGDTLTVDIQNEDDCIYFAFIPEETSEYAFYSFDNDGDPIAALFDTEGTEIERSDDDGDGNNFKIKGQFTAGETYYFQSGCYGGSTGSYSVRLKKRDLSSTVTVTLIANGGYWYDYEDGTRRDTLVLTNEYGEEYIDLPHPYNDDQDKGFEYWGRTSEGDNIGWVNTWSVEDGDITLYAIWSNYYNVTLDTNGGTYSDGSTVKTYREVGGESAFLEGVEIPQQKDDDHRIFIGWSLEPDGPKYDYDDSWGGYEFYDEDSSVWEISYNENITLELNQDITLYAIYDDAIIINLVPGEGYFNNYSGNYTFRAARSKSTRLDLRESSSEVGYVTVGDHVWNDPNISIADNEKVLSGWSLEPDGEILHGSIRPSEDMFLYAVWKEEILVTFDANGGYYYGEYWDEGFEHAVNPEVIQRRPGENGIDGEVMCPKPVIRNMDLAFAGWSYEKDGEVVYEEDQWWIPIEETVTLYAVWKDAYAVTMDANGGYYMGYWDEITHTDVQEGTDKIVQKVVKGKSLSIRRPDSYNESEGLWGFSLEKDGEVVLLNDNYSYGEDTNRYTPDGNCTLYAVWKPAAEITLDANGGYYIYLYDDSDNNLTINKEYIIPGTRMHLPDERDVQYEGDEKELKGWSLTRNGNLVGEDDDPFAYTPSGKCTLYAIWSGDEVKVSSILLNYSEMSVVKGVSQQVSVQVFPDDATDKSIIWSSSDEKIAKVDKNGKVTGVGAGTATITALAADGSGVAAECNVIVIAKTITMTDVSAISYNKLNVSWEKCDDADGYLVYRKGNGEAYTLVKSLNREDSTSFTNSVVSGAKYTYKVSAYKMDGKKKVILAQTGEMSGTALPAAPVMKSTGMAAFNKIKVIWTKVSGCAGYVIYRSTEEDGQYTVLKTVTMATATEYSNIVQDGQTYYYKIRAFVEVNGKKVYGDYSEVLSGDVIDAPPANFRLEQKTSTKIIFNWDKVDDAEGYVIYRYFPDTNKCKAIKNISSKDTLTYSYKVDADTDYQFTMRAFRVVNGKKVYSDYTERISN